ncbi:MAG TPA: GAP family protein [Acidimicrobiales bacterium]
MGAVIGQILGNAVGVAISPIPIIAVILMLFSRSAMRNSVMFALGWVTGLAGTGLIVLAIGVDSSDGGESDAGGFVKIVLGALFLFLAVQQWRHRPVGDAAPTMPRWMSAIDSLSAVKAVGLGLVLTVANPKNLGLTIAAASTISGSGIENGEQVVTMMVFVLIASLTILAPVATFLIARDRATPVLEVAKGWLLANNSTVMAVLLFVLGAKVLGDGISIVA